MARQPHEQTRKIAGIVVDAVRSRRELVLDNAVLRHQVNVLRFTFDDRIYFICATALTARPRSPYLHHPVDVRRQRPR